jgi:hypothetical protein
VPIFYRNELYIVGHNGACYDDSTAGAVKWNGAGWSTVAALSGVAKEWQACCTHGDYLLLGNTGQTSERRDDTTLASVYRYDGSTLSLVKNVPNYSEVSCIASIGGILFASFCSGFRYDSSYDTPGDCQIWISVDDGANWTLDATLPQPSVYSFIEFDGSVIAVGGGNGQGTTIYRRGDAVVPMPITPVAPTLPTPTGVIGAALHNVINVRWDTPTSNLAAINGYEVMKQAHYNGATAPVQLYPFTRAVGSTTTNADITPQLAGVYTFRVRSGAWDRRAARNQQSTTLPFIETSDWSEWSAPVYYEPEVTFATPAAPTVAMPTTETIVITFASCPENSLATTELYYSLTVGTINRYDVYSHGVTSVTMIPPWPGERYTFYIKYVLGNSVSALSPASTQIVTPSSFNAPANVLASFTSASTVQLTWQDQSTGEAVFDVERYNVSSNSYSSIAALPANTTVFVDTGITNAVLTRYRVRARGGLVVSNYVESNFVPSAVGSFIITKGEVDLTNKRIYYSVNTSNWTSYNNYPAHIVVETSGDGITYTTYETFAYTGQSLSAKYVAFTDEGRTLNIRLTAINGSGAVYSNVILTLTAPSFYTAPTPPMYDPGTAYGESLVWGKDGAGEADYALTGLVNLAGNPYAATTTAIGLLDGAITEAEIITQPLGDEWSGQKTIFVAELDASTNRDISVMIGSRSDYKDVSFVYGKEIPFHKTGKTGYIKAGREFEVRLRWTSGYAHYLKIFGGRVWAKLTNQSMKTVPYFFGKKGFDPKGGK